MDNKQIEDMITNPLNTSVIGYVSSGRNTTPRYFVCIQNKQKRTSENFYIDKGDIAHFEAIIKTSETTRASKKAELKAERRKKEEAKIRELETLKNIADEDKPIDETEAAEDDFEDIALEEE